MQNFIARIFNKINILILVIVNLLINAFSTIFLAILSDMKHKMMLFTICGRISICIYILIAIIAVIIFIQDKKNNELFFKLYFVIPCVYFISLLIVRVSDNFMEYDANFANQINNTIINVIYILYGVFCLYELSENRILKYIYLSLFVLFLIIPSNFIYVFSTSLTGLLALIIQVAGYMYYLFSLFKKMNGN